MKQSQQRAMSTTEMSVDARAPKQIGPESECAFIARLNRHRVMPAEAIGSPASRKLSRACEMVFSSPASLVGKMMCNPERNDQLRFQ